MDTLIVKIRQVIRFQIEKNEMPIDEQVYILLDNYAGNREEILHALLEVKDYTTPYAAEYIMGRRRGDFNSLEELARKSDIKRFEKGDFASVKDVDDAKNFMIFYGYFNKQTMGACLLEYENVLRKALGGANFAKLREYVESV